MRPIPPFIQDKDGEVEAMMVINGLGYSDNDYINLNAKKQGGSSQPLADADLDQSHA